ncbi:hypothetical protein BRC98_00900 [Halobacteriales archaeon QS_7_68_65]|nr:MAG: hypothetical protein BRC98_00900 [Halobacteriales archaeon QS_7_68_65]
MNGRIPTPISCVATVDRFVIVDHDGVRARLVDLDRRPSTDDRRVPSAWSIGNTLSAKRSELPSCSGRSTALCVRWGPHSARWTRRPTGPVTAPADDNSGGRARKPRCVFEPLSPVATSLQPPTVHALQPPSVYASEKTAGFRPASRYRYP